MIEYSNRSSIYYFLNISKFVLMRYFFFLQYSWIFYVVLLLSSYILSVFVEKHHYVLFIHPKHLLYFFLITQKHHGMLFTTLVDITVVDFIFQLNRFQLNWICLSNFFNIRLVVRLFHLTSFDIFSLTSVYKSAGWFEREIWDMFGIFFVGHSDLRRILTDYSFFSHPLRKDFPLTGFSEIFYDDFSSTIVETNVSLQQFFRNFIFLPSWFK